MSHHIGVLLKKIFFCSFFSGIGVLLKLMKKECCYRESISLKSSKKSIRKKNRFKEDSA